MLQLMSMVSLPLESELVDNGQALEPAAIIGLVKDKIPSPNKDTTATAWPRTGSRRQQLDVRWYSGSSTGSVSPPDRHVVRWWRTHCAGTSHSANALPGSPLSDVDALQHADIERLFCYHFLQISVIPLQLPQAPGFQHIHATRHGIPVVKWLFPAAELASKIRERIPGFGLMQYPDDLFVYKSLAFHKGLLVWETLKQKVD
jgi:hypothetical protein